MHRALAFLLERLESSSPQGCSVHWPSDGLVGKGVTVSRAVTVSRLPIFPPQGVFPSERNEIEAECSHAKSV